MEKTKEERAREHFGEFINGRCIAYDDRAERCYILGATEQEAIDKRLILGAYCKRCQDMGGGYMCSHKCQEYLEFEKTLENIPQ